MHERNSWYFASTGHFRDKTQKSGTIPAIPGWLATMLMLAPLYSYITLYNMFRDVFYELRTVSKSCLLVTTYKTGKNYRMGSSKVAEASYSTEREKGEVPTATTCIRLHCSSNNSGKFTHFLS